MHGVHPKLNVKPSKNDVHIFISLGFISNLFSLFNKFDLPLHVLYFHATGVKSSYNTYIECEGTTFFY